MKRLRGTSSLLWGAFILVGLLAGGRSAAAQSPAPELSFPSAPVPEPVTPPLAPPPQILAVGSVNHQIVVPSHINVGNEQYEGTLGGMRSYLESVRSAKPDLYAQLSPDLSRLEDRATEAKVILGVGVAAGLAGILYGFLGRNSCPLPSAFDPGFEEKSAAWDACNESNMSRSLTFSLIGAGAFIAGGAAFYALYPDRNDLFELVNKHNRLNHDPLQFQLGYDSAHRVAMGGATLSF